uniref:Putative gamma-glutamylcyclotransferase n=1 Tax=Brassica oleracea var. oleracea TaxID=109376 RepID=A0A0D3AWH0_BRAOL
MGRMFEIELEGPFYTCIKCHTHLGVPSDIISKEIGQDGRYEYEFTRLFNTFLAERPFNSAVKDIFCVGCSNIIGIYGVTGGSYWVLSTIRRKKKMSSSVSPSHNVFVYGSFQEPAVVVTGTDSKGVKGRLHPCIDPFETGVINGKVLTGLTDAQLENLDMIEGDEYERKTVEVVLTDTLEKMEVEAFIWANKDDPDMYGEWDFEVELIRSQEWKRLHMEKFIEASKKFIEWKKNPNGKTREEFAKFVNEDPPVA